MTCIFQSKSSSSKLITSSWFCIWKHMKNFLNFPHNESHWNISDKIKLELFMTIFNECSFNKLGLNLVTYWLHLITTLSLQAALSDPLDTKILWLLLCSGSFPAVTWSGG
ncbi:hypothetical protein GOODEAATRI_032780 [Goodea atripinnis]|uniref:Uncharacterized protein n=1 Tax=Goodea atripinnis TaxID=208336 RepID=A0ABV0MML7_9TELE